MNRHADDPRTDDAWEKKMAEGVAFRARMKAEAARA